MTSAKAAVKASTEVAEQPSQGSAVAGRLAGAIGLVLLITTPFTYLIAGAMDAAVWTKLLFALAALGVYGVTNSNQLARVGGSRATPLVALSGGSVVAVFIVLAVLNYAGAKHVKEFDVTREGIYTLSEQTVGVLKRLKAPVTIYAFYAPDDREYGIVQQTLKRYAAESEQLKVQVVSPANRPDLVARFNLQAGGPRIIVTAGDKDARAKQAAEEELTNAITTVTRGESKIVYFLTGHGEADLADEKGKGLSDTVKAVRSEGFEVKPLNLAAAEAAELGAKVALEDNKAGAAKALTVPADAAVLIIAGPRGKLFDPEVAAVEAYLEQGGRVIAMLESDSNGGLDGLLRQYKVALHNDLVVDTNPVNQLLGYGAAAVLVHAASEHPITAQMGAPAVMPLSRSLAIEDGGEAGVVTTPLLVSDASAWGEVDYKAGTAERNKEDTQGPVTSAAIAVRDRGEKAETRLVVFGDADWATNQYRDAQANSDLFLNTLAWLTEQADKITIRPKTRPASQLLLTGNQMNTLILASMDALPVLLIALGVGIMQIRRQR